MALLGVLKCMDNPGGNSGIRRSKGGALAEFEETTNAEVQQHNQGVAAGKAKDMDIQIAKDTAYKKHCENRKTLP